jgi:hypothetical protein
MSYIAHELNRRVQILQSVDTPNSSGGFTRSYKKLTRVWCKVKTINEFGILAGITNVRGQNISDFESHELKMRRDSVRSAMSEAFGGAFADGYDSQGSNGLGKELSSAFDQSFESILDISPIKSEFFVFLEEGSATKGRLLRVKKALLDERNRKYIKLKCCEVEERGTGWVI